MHGASEIGAIDPTPGDAELKKEIWSLKIAPKIQQFLWRVLTGSLASATQLQTRSIPVDSICQRCCNEDETINHLLFTCPYAVAVWRCANIRFGNGHDPSDILEENIRHILNLSKMTRLPHLRRLLPFWLLWRIWKSRNDYIFQKKSREPASDTNKCIDEVQEWLEANQDAIRDSDDSQIRGVRDKRWSPPPIGWVKCNFDSTYIHDRSYTGTGWILRDHQGQFLHAGTAKLQPAHDPLQAEALGFLHALQSVWASGFRYVWFESDNLELTNLINKYGDHLLLGNLLYDIRFWMMKLPESSLDFVNREKNEAADKLSKKASEIDSVFCNYSSPPFWLRDYLYEPFTI